MYKVLIADDEWMVRLNLRTLVERDSDGFTIVGEAKDGEQALQLSLELKPDLIITDIRMPALDGLELIRRLYERNDGSEFLVVSGYNDFGYAQSALRYGVADYLLKPIDPDYFVTAMQKVCDRLTRKAGKRNSPKDWMWHWKTYAECTAKALWHLNAEELKEELERIRTLLEPLEDRAHPELKERIEYFTIVLNGELRELNQSDLPLTQLHLSENAMYNAELYEAIRSGLLGLAEHIRASRNWWTYNRLIKRVSMYIEENYKSVDLSLKDVAAYFELSPNYFGTTFKKETGLSFNQYLTQLRMEKAKQYLQNPLAKVYEVGELVGFDDYAYFSKIFKKYTGVSPSEYKKYETAEAET